MSMTLAVKFQKSGFQCNPEDDLPAEPGNYFNAGAIPYVYSELDKLIGRGGVRPVSDYLYDGDMLSDEEYAEMGQTRPKREWFSASEGLGTVNHLIGLLKERDPEEQLEGCTIDGVLYELEVLQSILSRAEQSGESFSFDVG